MIDRVHIEGFQSLADVDLTLGGFTVIQGRSNSGKSAVIRALRALASNGGNLRGTGGSYINHHRSKVVVTLERDGSTLVWSKSAKKTTYDLDGRVFTTGQEVPAEVDEWLKIGDLVVDEQNNLKVNVNFQGGARGQGQFEPPFLVVDRPGSYLAKVLALLTSASLLYSAQALAKKDSRKFAGTQKTLREVHEGNVSSLATLQAEHAPLRDAAAKAKTLIADLDKARAEHERLARVQARLANAAEQLVQVTGELESAEAADPGPAVEKLEGLLASHSTYTQWSAALRSVTEPLAEIDATLAKQLPDDVDDKLTSLDALLTQVNTYSSWHRAVSEAAASIATVDAEIEAERAHADTAVTDLMAVIDEVGVCPTCDQQMNAAVMVS